jgi:hypothetical protein
MAADSKLNTAEICKLAGIDPPSSEVAPAQFLKTLVAENLLPEAVRFMANAFPARKAVEWALDCLKDLTTQERTTGRAAALKAVADWLASNTEQERRAAQQAAELATLDCPEGVLSMAAFMSGGSIAPTTAPEVPPPANVCQKLVAGAVMLAVVGETPEKAPVRFKRALDLAHSRNSK